MAIKVLGSVVVHFFFKLRNENENESINSVDFCDDGVSLKYEPFD